MNSLIIGACFVVALLAIAGLVFALREPAAPAVKKQEAIPDKTPVAPTSAPTRSEAKTTTQLSDQPMTTTEVHPSEQPTTLLTTPVPTAPVTNSNTLQTEEQDIDELDYAELPTIRSLPSNHYEGERGQEERSQVTHEHLQTIANELRALHTQMKNMEQRINVLTDQVQYIRGNDEPDTNWDMTNSAFKVPAQ